MTWSRRRCCPVWPGTGYVLEEESDSLEVAMAAVEVGSAQDDDAVVAGALERQGDRGQGQLVQRGAVGLGELDDARGQGLAQLGQVRLAAVAGPVGEVGNAVVAVG